MNFDEVIEKVFKQHPFIYKIGMDFYVLGVGVCRKINSASDLTKRKYKSFWEAVDKGLTQKEAWSIIKGILFDAKTIMEKEDGIDIEDGKEIDRTYEKLRKKLLGFNWNEKEKQELEIQVKKYNDFWIKHHISDMYSL